MALNVGHVEHVISVDLPLVSDDNSETLEDITDDMARRAFDIGNNEFSKCPWFPMEIQDMVWKATIQPRTVRAIAQIEETEAEWDELEWNEVWYYQSLGRWIIHERNPLHVKHFPIYSVCRRSRAVALATFGHPIDNNTTLFHPDLDMLELVG